MAGQALYLKYRPRTFDQVVGQEHIMRTLRNALRQNRFRHAYLFAGPRGTGKTTTARILAKAINCLAPEPERPCNACAICNAINDGRLMDLIEIDAASNRGIDEIRDIREKVGFRPSQAGHKVYVLDEAHMLTGEAFNALLKTLEEPPPHVVFVLVTTEPHKIPATIASRCQRFDFRRVPLSAIVERLAFVAQQEGLNVEPAALELLARQSTGSVRDAVSLLDQLSNYGDEIRLDQVQSLLGTASGEAACNIVACLASGDAAGGLDLVNRAIGDGADPHQLGREVLEQLRSLLLIQEGAGTRLLNATAEQAAHLEALAARIPNGRVLRAIRLFSEATTNLRRRLDSIPQLPLEMALVESMLDQPAVEPTAEPVFGRQPSSLVAAPAPAVSEPAVGPVRQSERIPAPVAGIVAEPSVPLAPAPLPQDQAGPLTLAQVQRAWKIVVQAMRQRNPTTQAALASGCKPVEVVGTEIVVTFPFKMLGEKLRDPQRTLEIEEAFSEVLHARCRVKLVEASEYTPRQEAAQESQASASPATSAELQAEDEVPGPIAQWAEEHGGKAKLIRT